MKWRLGITAEKKESRVLVIPETVDMFLVLLPCTPFYITLKLLAVNFNLESNKTILTSNLLGRESLEFSPRMLFSVRVLFILDMVDEPAVDFLGVCSKNAAIESLELSPSILRVRVVLLFAVWDDKVPDTAFLLLLFDDWSKKLLRLKSSPPSH